MTQGSVRASQPSNARRAILRFTVAGLVTLAVVTVPTALVARAVARNEAINAVRLVTATLSTAVIKPNLSDGLLTGQPDALRRMDKAVAGRITGVRLVRIKLWTPTGRIIYSDEPRLIRDTYPLGDRKTAALREGRTVAQVSDLSKPENRFERGYEKLLEVYQPVRTPSGQVLLFETYFSYWTVTERKRRIWAEFAPILFGSLVLLQVVQIPLAWQMARRLDANQRERERLMREAVAASDATRRRIAGDVHDGVVQDLIAASYTLTSAASQTVRHDDYELLRGAAETVRGGVRSLRSLLVEIYPPSLHTAGLPAALAALASSVSGRGVNVNFSAPDTVSASTEAEELVLRTAQQALHNILTHAEARRVDLALQRHPGLLVLTVADDGVGFDPDTVFNDAAPAHFGLRFLRDLAADAGASLEVDSVPGRGTQVRLEVPAP